ncbi:hypothetical protein Aab01nite_11540 [Paractinoplanes abujensis]|uniref:Two-component system sensor histidine kinase DesK n=1 Tax=Paractinoplanes abujensis TaxID=882441 RepID=A0A7W7CPT0_9ACTN|nr:sensor histidine kinase [Actinoplanes abujensis]MBB4691023.1 two-component system sensor histidine kinase DesK [Actinoplanes abujensis]GID17564.1 hypothetical protein Aab01nite_11540 [Actinoplanes abujensis]
MRSQTDRFELYIKVTLYSNVLLVPLIAGGAVLSSPHIGLEVLPVAATTAVHVLLCVLLIRAGIAAYPTALPLLRPAAASSPAPGRRLVRLIAAGAVSAVVTCAAAVAYPDAAPGDPDPTAAVLLMNITLYAVALATVLRATIVVCAAGLPGCTTLAVVAGPGSAIALAAVLLVLAPAARVTLWTLGLVRELDEARRVQAGLAVTEERLRISRDLHDVLGRTLSVVALKAELSARLAQRGRAEAADEMLEVRRIAQDALVDLRAVVGSYRTADLPTELAGARSLLESAGITCHLTGDAATLPAPAQAALGWVVREGTTNVLRHSEATTCRITLTTAPGTATLTMSDDGVPSAPDSHDASCAPGPARLGNGLTGLRERIAALNGTMTAAHTPPAGFTLTVHLPLPTPAS